MLVMFSSFSSGWWICLRESLPVGRKGRADKYHTTGVLGVGGRVISSLLHGSRLAVPAPCCVFPRLLPSSRLKNEASMFSQTVRSFNMQHRLLLTGTPLQVTAGFAVIMYCCVTLAE